MIAPKQIQMVDLKSQYQSIKQEVDRAVLDVIESGAFINGPAVKAFQKNMETYNHVKHVIPCANGTDALQIALMALDLKPGDEVIVPAFTYVASAEVIGLLRLKPVMVDVDPHTFNLTPEIFADAITPATKAVIPVHLFGQSADMEGIMQVANQHGIYVIEDNAQAIGADFHYANGTTQKTGTIGHIGTTSFYPSKNLGAFGDGGAIMTNDDQLAESLRMIANHGQNKRYYHSKIGCNSRLDSIQAAILNIKLRKLDQYAAARNKAAAWYDAGLSELAGLEIPVRFRKSNHVFHQYTLKVKGGQRDELKDYLSEKGIPTMIYYPVSLHEQEAFKGIGTVSGDLKHTKQLCEEVLSLPMHSEMDKETSNYIIDSIREYFVKKS